MDTYFLKQKIWTKILLHHPSWIVRANEKTTFSKFSEIFFAHYYKSCFTVKIHFNEKIKYEDL